MPTVKDLMDAQGRVDLTGLNVKVELVDESDIPKPRLQGQNYQKMHTLGGSAMNVFAVMTGISQPERRMLTMISQSIKWPEYIVNMSLDGLTKSQKSNWHRTYNKLKKRDLVRRVGTEGYLINPKLVVPSPVENEQSMKLLWDKLK